MKKQIEGVAVYVGPFFPDILKMNGGIFPDDSLEIQIYGFAAWYFAKCAHIALLDIPGQATLEGETDITVSLRNILNGCMQAYGFDNESGDEIEKVMRLMPLCRRWAFITGKNWHGFFQTWIESAGKLQDTVTRNPEQI